jgi:K+-sensing histidine kinase KdpD
MQAKQIMASCERLRLMTESQILQYKHQIERLSLKPHSLTNDTIYGFLNALVRPFEKDVELAGMRIEYRVSLHNVETLVTDWNVLQCGLFHLVYNAVKHGRKGSIIYFDVETISEYSLSIRVLNECQEKVTQRDWDKLMLPLFAFQRIIGPQTDSSSVGIGLSTANSLAQALNGNLSFEIDDKLHTFCAIMEVQCGGLNERISKKDSDDSNKFGSLRVDGVSFGNSLSIRRYEMRSSPGESDKDF